MIGSEQTEVIAFVEDVGRSSCDSGAERVRSSYRGYRVRSGELLEEEACCLPNKKSRETKNKGEQSGIILL